jgi:hypothetical protein
MPLAYPNLDHRQFNYSVTTGAGSDDVSSLTRLPSSISSLANSPLPSLYAFQAEEKVLSKAAAAAAADESKSSYRSSLSELPAGSAAGSAAPPPSIATEEAALNASLESARKSEEESKTSAAAGSGAVRRAMLQRMRSLTMAGEGECEGYLEKADYNLEQAVQEFYQNN